MAEVFAGIGGFRLGLEPLGGACVFASELCRKAQETYAANWPGPAGLLRESERERMIRLRYSQERVLQSLS